jgi:arsenical pump membrane protein
VAGVVARPRRLPAWAAPAACAAVALASGAAPAAASGRALRALVDPIAFLLAAVPLATLLDKAGVFAAAARRLGTGAGLVPGLWALAAVATAVLNLDASVVLLTPLYVRLAARSGHGRLALGSIPMVAALLASSALPVSNLTNLIAASRLGLSTGSFLAHLGPPSLAACALAYPLHRRLYPPPGRPGPGVEPQPGDATAFRLGGATLAFLLAGFLAGPALGVAPWAVALAADAALVAWLRRLPLGALPWRSGLLAASLAVLAEAVAASVRLGPVLSAGSPLAAARAAGAVAAGANLLNNLPAFLVALPFAGRGVACAAWPALVGANMGPGLLVSGSLAGLLWASSMGAMGREVGPSEFARLGLRVVLPGAAAALAVLVALGPALGCP